MTAILEFSHVSRFYRTVIGVGDINIELQSGAYGLVGPNGSGKTTFINLVTGVLAPSIGTVRVFDMDPVRNRKVLSKIGLCPASDILLPTVSGFQWVEYLTALNGFSQTEARERALESMVRVGMEENMHRLIGNYSLGMRQRTKLAQAIAHEPELLILDEPFNGLDPIGRHELTELLNEWIKRGRSLILASHILHEVEAITSSFLLIHGGRILASGNAGEVRSMLSGFPVEVRVGGSGMPELATALAGEPWLRGLDLNPEQSHLTIRVADKSAFQERLMQLSGQQQIAITSMDSPDGSLEAAFDLLLRVHRGEQAF